MVDDVKKLDKEDKEEEKESIQSGSILLTLHRARHLEGEGKLGKADPYAVLTFGKDKFKTKTVKNNHNPEWNHDIKFDVDDETPEEVTLEVFDEDIGKDDALGKATICLREIINHKKVVNQWIELEDVKTGDVLFSAEYVPSEETEEEKIPVEGHARKESVASVHSQKVDSRKASLENSTELRKQSQGSIQSEKKEFRKHSRVSAHDHSGKEDTEDEETDVRLSRKQSKGSIHSEKVGSRKQSRVSVHDHSDKGEDEQEIDLKQPRKQSEASVHSEKLASRKHSRVSTYDHSGKEDEKEDAEEGELPSSISISSISHMVSSVKPVSDNEETSSDKDEKHDSLPSGSVTVTIHKAKDLDGHCPSSPMVETAVVKTVMNLDVNLVV